MARSVVIVGAGPAGMSAALEAHARGARVTIVDEAARPGGQIYRQPHANLAVGDFAAASERARKERLLGAFKRIIDFVDYRPGTSAFSLFRTGELQVSRGNGTELLRAEAVVLTSGVREITVPFPGWTTPGVMYAGGLQALLKSQSVLAGRRIVIAGAGPLPIVVAAQILRAGGTVATLAALNSWTVAGRELLGLWSGRELVREALSYLATILRAGVPLLTRYVPVRISGREEVDGVVLARVDQNGIVLPDSERAVACDLVAVNYGFAANSELAAMAGVGMHYDRGRGGWLPLVDAFGRTSVPGVFVAGDAAGLRGALVAEAEGRIVGAAAAAAPQEVDRSDFRERLAGVLTTRKKLCAFQGAVQSLLRVPAGLWRLPTDDTVICRCENVTLGALRDGFAAGHLTQNATKRMTRAGMGWCGGRTCLHAVAALAELHGGASGAMMTPRPLARPVPLGALANNAEAGA
jgi:NADPH-dependent 2,4-dienoyl-CoA reductase/sulfur reductase-like enzyme